MSELKSGRKLTEQEQAHLDEMIASNKGRKHPPEFGAAISKRMSGRIVSDETRAKLSKAHSGKKRKPLSAETRAKISDAQKGKPRRKHTIEERRHLAEVHRGEKSHLWKGGVSDANRRDTSTVEYKIWRDAVFQRDLYSCRLCAKKGATLQAHHIKSWVRHEELRYDVDNGITLCKKCHDAHHIASGGVNVEPLPIEHALTVEEVAEIVAKNKAEAKERAKSATPRVYPKPTQKQIDQLIERNKSRVWTDEMRAKVGEAGRGRVASDETRKKISEAHKGHTRPMVNTQTPEAKAKRSESMRGQKRTPEQRAKMSESAKERTRHQQASGVLPFHTPDAVAKRADTMRGRTMPEDIRERMADAARERAANMTNEQHTQLSESAKRRCENNPPDMEHLRTPEALAKRAETMAARRTEKEAEKAEDARTTAEKISAALKGKPKSAEHRAALSAARKRIMTPEHRAKIAEQQRGRKQSAETIAKRAEKARGRHVDTSHLQTDDVKAKRNAALRGQKRTPEQLERIRAAAKRRVYDTSHTKSPEAKAKFQATWAAKRADTEPTLPI